MLVPDYNAIGDKPTYEDIRLKMKMGQPLSEQEILVMMKSGNVFGDKVGEVDFDKVEQLDDIPKLIVEITSDVNLPIAKKQTYINMAYAFLSKFEDNLSRTSISLNTQYPQFTIDQWSDWLKQSTIKKYLTPFKKEKNLEQIDRAFAEGKATAGAINLRNELERDSKTNNSNLVILRMPIKDTPPPDRYV